MDKILKIQSEIGVLSKDKTNPFYKSQYFDINSLIAQLLPLLEKYKLCVVQPLTMSYEYTEDGGHHFVRPALMTTITDTETNTRIISEKIPLPDLQDPQKMGSAITYYRRYALQSLFLLQAEDDDANATVKKVGKLEDKELDF